MKKFAKAIEDEISRRLMRQRKEFAVEAKQREDLYFIQLTDARREAKYLGKHEILNSLAQKVGEIFISSTKEKELLIECGELLVAEFPAVKDFCSIRAGGIDKCLEKFRKFHDELCQYREEKFDVNKT